MSTLSTFLNPRQDKNEHVQSDHHSFQSKDQGMGKEVKEGRSVHHLYRNSKQRLQ